MNTGVRRPRPAIRALDPARCDPIRHRKSFVVGRPALGAASGRWSVSAVEPILGDGELLGIVGVVIDLSSLTNALSLEGNIVVDGPAEAVALDEELARREAEASISQTDAGGRRYVTAILRDVSEQFRAQSGLRCLCSLPPTSSKEWRYGQKA